jgi:hypothetical protein
MSPVRSVALDPQAGDRIRTAGGTVIAVVSISRRGVHVRDPDGYPFTLTTRDWADRVRGGAVLLPLERL